MHSTSPLPPLPPLQDMFTPWTIFLQAFYAQHLAWFIEPHLLLLEIISATVSLLFLGGIFYAFLMLREVSSREYHQYKAVDMEAEEEERHRVEWQIVLNHLRSEHPAEWKLAILEADNLLVEVLGERGFEGESIGEKLKNITNHDLVSINDAWEAHKVRNRIAHEGSAFSMTDREAERVVALYEKVLKELDYF